MMLDTALEDWRRQTWRDWIINTLFREKFVSAASGALIIRILGAGLAFFSQILLARWMGISEFGIYAFVWTCILAAGIISQLGLGISSTRLVAQYAGKNRPDRLRSFIGFVAAAVTISGSLIAIAVTSGLLSLNGFTINSSLAALYLAFALLPLMALHEVARGVTRGMGHVNSAYFPGFLARPGLFLLILAGLYFAGYAITAPVAIAAFGAVLLVVTAYQWHKIISRMPAAVNKHRTPWHTKRWLALCLPVILVDGQYLMLSYLDVLVLNAWVEPDKVAQYFAAARIVALLTFVHFAVSAASAHQIARFNADGKNRDLPAAMKKYIAWTFWPTALGIGLLLPTGSWLLSFFGPGFAEGYYIMPVLVIGILVQAATGPVKYLLAMTGQQNLMAVILGATTLMNLGLNFWLIPSMGLQGAAIATSVSLSFASLSLAAVTRYRLGFWPLIGCVRQGPG